MDADFSSKAVESTSDIAKVSLLECCVELGPTPLTSPFGGTFRLQRCQARPIAVRQGHDVGMGHFTLQWLTMMLHAQCTKTELGPVIHTPVCLELPDGQVGALWASLKMRLWLAGLFVLKS